MKAGEILGRASELVSGERARTHGDALLNHTNIAHLWTGWLRARRLIIPPNGLTAHDVAILMALLKASRTLAGAHNEDDHVDGSAYMAIAGEIAEATK